MNKRPRLTPRHRLVAAAAGVALAALVGIAWRLAPDARGWGTHEQLGFSPCRVRQWTGRPCPTCGMTTAWTLAVRGKFRQAASANAGGLFLMVCAVLGAIWILGAAAAGRWLVGRPKLRWVLGIGTAGLIVTLVDWARRLASG